MATTGTSAEMLVTVGVTMIAPSMRVPLSRLSERRSHPSPPACRAPLYASTSKGPSRSAAPTPLSTSALKGSKSATSTPITPVVRARMLLATRLVSYPSRRTTSSTRSAVAAFTP